jgi:hypothetical protein
MIFRNDLIGKIIERCGYPSPLPQSSQTWNRINGFLENRLTSILSENNLPSLMVLSYQPTKTTDQNIIDILKIFGNIYDLPSDFGRLVNVYPNNYSLNKNQSCTLRENDDYPIVHQIENLKYITRKFNFIYVIDYQKQISLDEDLISYSNVDIDLENRLVADVVDQELSYKAGGNTYFSVTNDLNKRGRRNMQRRTNIKGPRIGNKL